MTPQDDGGGVVITLADIYAQVVGLAGQVVGLTTRVDAALAMHGRTEQTVADHDAALRPLTGAADRLTDHEARLRTLERGRWPLASVTALVALGSLVLAAVALLAQK